MFYEELLKEAYQQDIDIYEKEMSKRIKGLYADNVIWINDVIANTKEKHCVLAEELGHYHTSSGDILNQTKIDNRKQEKLARTWAHRKLITPSDIVEAFDNGVHNRFEMAEYLNVTEEFLLEAVENAKQKYGAFKQYDRYVVYFEPLAVLEIF